MNKVSINGIDLAKTIFQVHGVDAAGEVALERRLRRNKVLGFFAEMEPCLIGMEACATAHYWARELMALGHEVRLMPPIYVKPYVKRQKNDAADAAAICEAVTRPSMRFVPVKTEEMQAAKMLHTSRRLLVDQRTRAINSLRGQLAELGHVAPTGAAGLAQLVALVTAPAEESRLPQLARLALAPLADEIGRLRADIAGLERAIREAHRADETSRRLQTIPGIGPITASAILATVPDAAAFRDARHFAAWLGVVPQQNSTGGKQRLGRITKKGDRYLRTLLVTGATALLRSHGKLSARHRAWLERLKAKKPARLVTVALANKLARIVWALLAKGTRYRGDDEGASAGDTRRRGVGNTAVAAAV